jgi:hypothetical protein
MEKASRSISVIAPTRPTRTIRTKSSHRGGLLTEVIEREKIGGGTPRVLTRHGWLIVYHSVAANTERSTEGLELCYSAGVMVLSKKYPRAIVRRIQSLHRSYRLSGGGPSRTWCFPRHRQARRSRITGALRHLLWDGRRPLSALRALTYRIFFRQEDPPTPREKKSRATIREASVAILKFHRLISTFCSVTRRALNAEKADSRSCSRRRRKAVQKTSSTRAEMRSGAALQGIRFILSRTFRTPRPPMETS